MLVLLACLQEKLHCHCESFRGERLLLSDCLADNYLVLWVYSVVIFGNSVPTRRFPALVAFCGVVVLATLTKSLESACRAISSSTQLMDEENGPRREVDRGGCCCCELPSTSSTLLVESSSSVLFRLRAATGSLVLEGEGLMVLLMWWS